MKKRTFIPTISLITAIAVIAFLVLLHFVFRVNINLALLVAVVFTVVLLLIFFSLDSIRIETNKEIEENLNNVYREILNDGEMGIIMYDNNYEVTYLSQFFADRGWNHFGEKVLNWLPELQDMLNNEANNETITIDDETFLVRRVDKTNTLTFKNITKEYNLDKKLANEAVVVGMLSYDNYDEMSMSEDDLSYINTNIKIAVSDYFKNFNVIYKTLRNNRVLLLLNETIFGNLLNDRFSILNTVRKVSKDANLGVTLSMAFARGSDNLTELDESAKSLLDLAQTRGGDQVVVRKMGDDATFYGGTTEAREQQSKTKVRVTANTIKDLIERSKEVIIVGHRDMDADCVAAALNMSNIAISLDKPAYIVSRSGGIESMIGDVMRRYRNILETKHRFISENEALDLLNEETLVIMVDHHSAAQSNSPNLLKESKRIAIIDHHRRRADLDVDAMFVYIEAAASSACEITSEFLPYFGRNISITPEEANILYLGVLIDTDHFRFRTGSRTFDVAKQLRNYGADPLLCDELSQEPYDNIIQRSKIIDAGKAYKKDVIISAIEQGNFPRSIASQACDMMVKAKEIEAAFVVCNTEKEETMISARSKGKINVQVIMEKMNGGGHMTAAGLQVSHGSVPKLEAELLQVLDEYFAGGKDESNTVD